MEKKIDQFCDWVNTNLNVWQFYVGMAVGVMAWAIDWIFFVR